VDVEDARMIGGWQSTPYRYSRRTGRTGLPVRAFRVLPRNPLGDTFQASNPWPVTF
jgi:hypothetical protein